MKTFFDFCAGIGGGRWGLQNLGLRCVGFSETDRNAEQTYRCFFGNNEINYGDLMKIKPWDLPDFDLMVAGFPCQAFSALGQRRGLSDRRGQIIFGLLNIIKTKNVKYFILENVKGLINHHQGQTLQTIIKLLNSAGYHVAVKLMDSSHYGLPHKRERIYFTGVQKKLGNGNDFQNYFYHNPLKIKMNSLKKYLVEKSNIVFENKHEKTYQNFLKYLNNKYNRGCVSVNELLREEYLIIDTRQSDLRLYKGKIPTLRAGRHGIFYIKNGKFRKLSGYESLLLQGFDKKLAKKTRGVIPENRILSQAGNAMSVNVVYTCGRSLINFINQHIEKEYFKLDFKSF